MFDKTKYGPAFESIIADIIFFQMKIDEENTCFEALCAAHEKSPLNEGEEGLRISSENARKHFLKLQTIYAQLKKKLGSTHIDELNKIISSLTRSAEKA
jgi:hypothetical protein